MNEERIVQLEKLGITFVRGRKGSNDKIFYYNGKPISMIELGELYVELCKNEDELYPKSEGKMGADMIENFLRDIKNVGKLTDDIKRRYFLKVD